MFGVGVVGVVGVPPTPYCGDVIVAGMFLPQPIELLDIELVSRCQNDGALARMLDHKTNGFRPHSCRLATAHRCHQQSDQWLLSEDLACRRFGAKGSDDAFDAVETRFTRCLIINFCPFLLHQFDSFGAKYFWMVEAPERP